MAHSDLGFLEKAEAILERVHNEQAENISKATDLMVEAIKKDELIHVYGGGGHTTLVMGEPILTIFDICICQRIR